jgi:GTP-binding protein
MSDFLEHGRLLFARPFIFQKGAVSLDTLPLASGVEVAFAGRSNVGKSSLINALTRRKDLARTSNTPGRTQELNFFKSEVIDFTLVDMPGYGFAEAPKDKVRVWTKLVMNYLRGRVNLARIYVLIDGRHGFKQADLETLKILDTAAVSYQIILTKSDNVKPTEMVERKAAVLEELRKHPASYPEVIVTSSVTNEGIEELRGAFAKILSEQGYKF